MAGTVGTPELVEDFGELRRAVSHIGSGRALVDYETAAQALRQPEIVVLHWPLDDARLAAARADRVPRLLVIEGDDEPPADWDPLEDWVRLPADARDVRVRVAALRRRAASSDCRPSVDGFDRLIFDGRWVSLSPNDYKLIQPLVEHFDDVVPYEDVAALLSTGNGAAGSAGRVRLTRLRRRIAPLGLEIRTVRPHGLALTTRRSAS